MTLVYINPVKIDLFSFLLLCDEKCPERQMPLHGSCPWIIVHTIVSCKLQSSANQDVICSIAELYSSMEFIKLYKTKQLT